MVLHDHEFDITRALIGCSLVAHDHEFDDITRALIGCSLVAHDHVGIVRSYQSFFQSRVCQRYIQEVNDFKDVLHSSRLDVDRHVSTAIDPYHAATTQHKNKIICTSNLATKNLRAQKQSLLFSRETKWPSILLGLVVQKLINAKPGLKLTPSLLLKGLSTAKF